MMKFAATAVNDADVILMMIDATDTTSAKTHELIFTVLQQTKKPVYLLLNKIDIVPKQSLLSLIADYSANYSFKEVFPISALTKEGTEVLVSSIAQELPVHPPYYPSDSLSEQSVRFFVSEIIREKIFELFEEEIPYSTTVDVIEFTEKENRKTTIQAEIYIERDSQKAILIGKKGQAIKEIGVMARKDIELLLDKEVFLQLYVKVRENWREDDAWLKRLGYSE